MIIPSTWEGLIEGTEHRVTERALGPAGTGHTDCAVVE